MIFVGTHLVLRRVVTKRAQRFRSLDKVPRQLAPSDDLAVGDKRRTCKTKHAESCFLCHWLAHTEAASGATLGEQICGRSGDAIWSRHPTVR